MSSKGEHATQVDPEGDAIVLMFTALLQQLKARQVLPASAQAEMFDEVEQVLRAQANAPDGNPTLKVVQRIRSALEAARATRDH
jgi:hypothetical protein